MPCCRTPGPPEGTQKAETAAMTTVESRRKNNEKRRSDIEGEEGGSGGAERGLGRKTRVEIDLASQY